jgi:hypothetical protein
MSETQKDAQNAVVYINDKAHLELSADQYIYPIKTPDDAFKLYVAMKRYASFEIKKFFDRVLPKSKQRSATEISVETQDQSEIREFVMNNFLYFIGVVLEDGTEPSIILQRQWMEENPLFVERVFNFGINVTGRKTKDEEQFKKAVLVFGQKEKKIEVRYSLYSIERKIEEDIIFYLVLDKLSQSDKHQYDKATAVIRNNRRLETFFQGNWDVIEQLCNHRLKRIEGPVVVRGKACTEENREEWISLIPFITKISVMGEAIQDIELKNV